MNQGEREQGLLPVRKWNRQRIDELASLSRLRVWRFAKNSEFEAGVLDSLERLPMLQFLDFEDSELERTNLLALGRLRLVRRFILKQCRFNSDDFRLLCEQWAGGACPKLEELYLDGSPVTDDHLKAIGAIGGLRRLWVSGPGVSDAGLEHLGGLKKLEDLSLIDTPVTEEGVLRLATLPRVSVSVVNEGKALEKGGDHLFLAQVALQKSTKPLDQAQADAAQERLSLFLKEMEDWERGANKRASEIAKRHRAARPQFNVFGAAEAVENDQFWRDINAQKASIAERFCSQKLLARGVGQAASYGNPPHFQKHGRWLDIDTPSKTKTIFYGDQSNGQLKDRRKYTMILEDGAWKLHEVQWWSGGWKRDIV